MLWKLVFVAVLAVGVRGRSVQESDVYAELIKAYCEANNAEDKIPEVKASVQTFIDCLKADFDVKTLREEFGVSMSTKNFDQLFKNICGKMPHFKTCLHNLATGTSACQPPGVSEDSAKEGDRLLDFVCENDGAKLTSFFKEDGPKCFQDEQMAINTCNEAMKSNITSIIGKDGISAALKLTNEQRCGIQKPAVQCMVTAMKRCANPVPGQLFEDLSKKLTCFAESKAEKPETNAAQH